METVLDVLVRIDPEIMSGTPVFNGTRVPIQSLFDWLETETLDEFLDNFPSVTRKQALAAIHPKAVMLKSELIHE